MTNQRASQALTALALAALLCSAAPASAQVAGGTTTIDTSIVASTQLAMGWSVKKTLMGKTVYNDAGQKVGKVEDLIVSPDRNVSYVIVGAGGFIGLGRHDVAVPVGQITDKAGKLVLAGFHDPSGDALVNAELAKNRAKAVRAAITSQGVDAARVALRKPEQTAADGPADEARRVEIRLVD